MLQVLLITCSFTFTNAVRVLTSNVELEDYGDPISGAKLVNATNYEEPLKDFSLCIRFNYKVLGSKMEGKGRLITFNVIFYTS